MPHTLTPSPPGSRFGPLGSFVGILGGMGPLATVDLMHKMISARAAARDQEHVPVVAHNDARIPDRQLFLRGEGPSPLPALFAALDRLNSMGAAVIVIPCNTAHIWFDDLSGHSRAPILHIAESALDALLGMGEATGPIGLIATQGTVAAGFYQARIAARGYASVVNTGAELERWFTPGCYAVKAGQLETGGRLFEAAAQCLIERGATRLILACTEVPVGLAAVHSALLERSIDATEALARAAISWWDGHAQRVAA
jgi:aspartate racemase